MVVKIRFGRGPVVTRRKGKNGGAAMLLSSALTLTSVCIGSLGVWRLGEDLDIAHEFFIREGILSHWQVWIGTAAFTQYLGWRLNRHAKSAETRPSILEAEAVDRNEVKRAAATV